MPTKVVFETDQHTRLSALRKSDPGTHSEAGKVLAC